MKICEIEFASSSIAFSMQIVNELELNLFSLEFNYLRTTSLELNSVKRVRVKLNFSQTRDVSKFNFSRSRAAVASNIRLRIRFRIEHTFFPNSPISKPAKFCKKIFVGKLLTRSTRFTCFCTAQTSIFQKIFVKLVRKFRQFFAKNRYL